MTGIIRIGSNPPPAERSIPQTVLAGRPEALTQNYYTSRSGRFFTGVWESTPGRWSVNYSEDELCVLLSGRVVLTDESGRAEHFAAGDAFIIPAGFRGTWETVDPVRKVYAIHEGEPS